MMSSSARISASRADWSEAEHDPGTLLAPASHGRRQRPDGGWAAGRARASRRGCHRAARPRRRAPRSAPACGPPRAPASSRAARGRRRPSRAGSSPARSSSSATLLGLLGQESRPPPRRRPARRAPRRPRRDGRERWPARGSRPRAPRRHRANRRRSGPGRPASVSESRVAWRPSRASSVRTRVRSQEELAGRQQRGRRRPGRGRAGRPGRRRAASRPRRRTTRRARARAGRPGRRRGCRRGARTRRDRRPPARARSRAPRAACATRSMGKRAPRRRVMGCAGDVRRTDRVLEERLQAGHQDACRALGAVPRGEGGHARGRLVAHQLGALVRQRRARLEGHDLVGVTQPGHQLLGHAIGDLGVACDPDESLAGGQRQGRREVGLGAVGHGPRR